MSRPLRQPVYPRLRSSSLDADLPEQSDPPTLPSAPNPAPVPLSSTSLSAPTQAPVPSSSPASSSASPALLQAQRNWDWLSNVPLDILMAHHPGLRPSNIPAPPPLPPQYHASSSSANALNHSAPDPSATPASAVGPQSSHVTAPSSLSASAPQQAPSGDFETIPSRPLTSFEHPELMQWTYEEAVKNKDSFGTKDCTRMADGTSIRGQLITTFERVVRHACAEFWTFEVGPEHQDSVKNYSFWKTRYLWLVQKIAKKIEARCPEISWYTDHYKAFMWIEMHLKAENGKRADIKRKAEKRISEDKPSNAEASTKKTKRSHDASTTNSKLASVSTKKTSLSIDSMVEDVFSLDEDDEEDITTNKKYPRSKAPSSSKHAAAYPRKSLGIADGPLASTQDAVAKSSTSSSIGKEIRIPVRTTHTESSTSTRTVLKLPARARPALRSMDKDPSVVSNLNAEVANMASTSASTLLPATIADIRAALSTRFSSLEEIDLVHSALNVVETAQACGIDPAAVGDPEFLSWLQGLEALVPENDTDEDEVGQQFGHGAIGTWSYHQPLKAVDAFGSVRNACRLLAALLRIWAMAKMQMKDAKGEPLIHNHIGNVCTLMIEAFKIPSAQPKAPLPKTNSNTPRATASGKLSESRIRRLGQRRATTILELASIPIKDKKQAVDMLAAAWLSGTIVLSDQQVRQAEQNLPIEGTVKATEPDDD